MKQSKRVQIASESHVRVTSTRVSDTLAVVLIEDKLMTEEHILLLLNAIKELVSQNFTQIVVDLSRIKRINSTGLGSLISAYSTVHNKGGNLKIGGTNDFVKNVLNITKLSDVFEIHATKDEAIKSFQEP
jgi:anti-anti-sigma factor